MKRTPLRKISKKLSPRMNRYYKIKKEFLKGKLKCDACKRYSNYLEVHHVSGRFGERLCNEKDFMAVCRSCHEIIERNRKMSYEKGYLKTR